MRKRLRESERAREGKGVNAREVGMKKRAVSKGERERLSERFCRCDLKGGCTEHRSR